MDGTSYIAPVAPVVEPEHDLSTARGRLLYLRDVVVPRIPLKQMDMRQIDCGTVACLCGWAMRDQNLRDAGILFGDPESPISLADSYVAITEHGHFFGLTEAQGYYLFLPDSYGGLDQPTHRQLQTHINNVLNGLV
jgi:hypothetical protein